MPLGASRLNSLGRFTAPAGSSNLFTEATGTAPGSNSFTYTNGSGSVVSSAISQWNPACAYSTHQAESSGSANNPATVSIFLDTSNIVRRRHYYRSFTGTGTSITSVAAVILQDPMAGTFSKMYLAQPKLDRSTSGRGRWRVDSSSQLYGGHIWNGTSTGVTSTTTALPTFTYGSQTFFGSATTGNGSETQYHHEWFQDGSDIKVNVWSSPRDFTTEFTHIGTFTSASVTYYDSINDTVKGMGSPANTRGISFMFNVNTSTGKDELVICNGYVITRVQNIFGYSSITSTSNHDVLQSVSVSITNNQGAISFFNNTTKKMDIAMFTVSCPDTSTISVTWGSLFTTSALTGESLARLGKGNFADRFYLVTTNGGSNANIRAVTSTGVNNLTLSNTHTISSGGTITDLTMLGRFKDGNSNDSHAQWLYTRYGSNLQLNCINRA
jgi:hypothetical protein